MAIQKFPAKVPGLPSDVGFKGVPFGITGENVKRYWEFASTVRLPEMPNGNGTMTYYNIAAPSATLTVGFIFQAPKTGIIKKVGFYLTTVVSSGNMEIGHFVPASDGSLVAADETVSVPISSIGFYTGTFSVGKSVTVGDRVGIRFNSDSPNAPMIGILVRCQQGFPYCFYDSSGTVTKNLRAPITIVEYDDGTYAYTPQVFPMSGTATTSCTSTSATYRKAGNLIKLSNPMRCNGGWLMGDMDGDFTFDILDMDDNVLMSIARDKDLRGSAGESENFLLFEGATIDLKADTWYRVVISATTTTAVKPRYIDVPSAAAMNQISGGTNVYATTKNATTWTDTPTRRYMVGLSFDALVFE